jgi:hypothetical protein
VKFQIRGGLHSSQTHLHPAASFTKSPANHKKGDIFRQTRLKQQAGFRMSWAKASGEVILLEAFLSAFFKTGFT